ETRAGSGIVDARKPRDGEAALRLERGDMERTDRRGRQRAGPDGCGRPLLELTALREDAVGDAAELRARGKLVRDGRGRFAGVVEVRGREEQEGEVRLPALESGGCLARGLGRRFGGGGRSREPGGDPARQRALRHRRSVYDAAIEIWLGVASKRAAVGCSAPLR